jgi:hypothetical protein
MPSLYHPGADATTPVSRLPGEWRLSPYRLPTRIDLATGGELTVPLAGLVKLLVAPFVVAEFNKMVDKYIQNLTTVLETKPKKKVTRRS